MNQNKLQLHTMVLTWLNGCLNEICTKELGATHWPATFSHEAQRELSKDGSRWGPTSQQHFVNSEDKSKKENMLLVAKKKNEPLLRCFEKSSLAVKYVVSVVTSAPTSVF